LNDARALRSKLFPKSRAEGPQFDSLGCSEHREKAQVAIPDFRRPVRSKQLRTPPRRTKTPLTRVFSPAPPSLHWVEVAPQQSESRCCKASLTIATPHAPAQCDAPRKIPLPCRCSRNRGHSPRPPTTDLAPQGTANSPDSGSALSYARSSRSFSDESQPMGQRSGPGKRSA